ncbi:hypothetical protein Tco_1132183, partial [Tanacetum coccineum]
MPHFVPLRLYTRDHHPSTRYSANGVCFNSLIGGVPEFYAELMEDEHNNEGLMPLADEMKALYRRLKSGIEVPCMPLAVGRLTVCYSVYIVRDLAHAVGVVSMVPVHNLRCIEMVCLNLNKVLTDDNVSGYVTKARALRAAIEQLNRHFASRVMRQLCIGGRMTSAGTSRKAYLKNLRGSVSITGLNKVKEATEAREASLSQLKLNELEWSNVSDGSQKETDIMEVLDALKPYDGDLKKLGIVNYCGLVFPKWVGDTSFLRLAVMSTRAWRKNCTSLTNQFGQLTIHLRFDSVKFYSRLIAASVCRETERGEKSSTSNGGTLDGDDQSHDEPIWVADRVIAPTPGSAITILETANELTIK